MLELAPRETELVRGQEPGASCAAASPSYRLRPLEDPPVPARRRGLIAHLTAVFVAYHTA